MKGSDDLGLYVHIPFCARLCHYCDFAKTANFDQNHIKNYFSTIERQLASWLQNVGKDRKFTSVFLGGGTPGLFSHHYTKFFEIIRPHLAERAEITLEANPHNIELNALQTWHALGINRISIGVQSFDPIGLKALTRDHSADESIEAIKLARSVIPNVNADLIYSWPGQTMASWAADLEKMIDLGVNHLSLYALTFEGNTPFARANRRGKLPAAPDETQEEFYLHAIKTLRKAGFEHEEISNWAKPGYSCKHNWLYWTAAYFVGIGAGAHGYVETKNGIGMRYSYPGDLRVFLKDCSQGEWSSGLIEDQDRELYEWLMEYVGCGLRTMRGIDLRKIAAHGWKFIPTPMIDKGLSEGILKLHEQQLHLSAKDWFRETSWSRLVLECFHKNESH